MNEFIMALILSWMMNGVIRISMGKKIKELFNLTTAVTFLICYFLKDISTLNYDFILFVLWYIILNIIFENIMNVIIKKYKIKEN